MQPALGRIVAIDVLRGIAVLGMLLMNILGFGLPAAASLNPTVDGATSGLDLLTYQINWLFVEGAMRAIFCMLFGAGIIMFTRGKLAPAPAYYRRAVLLCIFGLIDMFLLLWLGDVLYLYGLAALLLYPFRHLPPRLLCSLGAGLLVAMAAGQWAAPTDLPDAPTAATLNAETSARQLGYRENFVSFAPAALELASAGPWRGSLWETIAMMWLGMALFKWDVLSAARSRRFYLTLAGVGYAVGLSTNTVEIKLAMASGYAPEWTSPQLMPTYQLGRLATALGHTAVVMLWCQAGHIGRLQGALADVGRLALTNYLMQSAIGLVLFTGVGFAWFGTLARTTLYLIVACVWLLQLGFSVWWLSRYRYGPMEWIWRWLTYGQGPPFSRERISVSKP